MNHFKTHMRVVAAFVLREIDTRYGKNPGGYLWAFAEPIAFIALMSFLMSAISHLAPLGTSYIFFYATGFMGFQLFKAMESYLGSSISANRSLLTYPVVAPIDAVFGRLILQAITTIIVSVIVISVASQTERYPITIYWGPIFQAGFLAWSLALGISLTNTTLFFRFPLYEKVYQVATRPLFLVSGVIYLPSSLPGPYRDVLLYNPVAHIVMLFRKGFYGDAGAIGLDMTYLVELTGVVGFVGMFLFTRFSVSHARP